MNNAIIKPGDDAPVPTPHEEPRVQLTEEELRARIRKADFEMGLHSTHLRLPTGLPRQK